LLSQLSHRGGLPQCQSQVNITLLADALMLISSDRMKCSVSTACLLVFLRVQNGDTLPHHLSKFAAEMHHTQHGTTANVPATLIYDALWVCVWQRNCRCGIHWEQLLVICKILYCWKHSSKSHIQLQWQWKNGPTSTTTQSIIDLSSVFQFSDNMSPPQSWHLHHLLPACSKYTYAVYHHLEYTCNTTDSTHMPTNFQQFDILPL